MYRSAGARDGGSCKLLRNEGKAETPAAGVQAMHLDAREPQDKDPAIRFHLGFYCGS